MTAPRAGQPATFEGGVAVVREVLSRRYGVSLDNFEMYDGIGLSRANRIPARTLVEILDLLTEKRYEYRLSLIHDGLQVAGEAGSSSARSEAASTTRTRSVPSARCTQRPAP
jgi:D-alanyl-D-alanine carboxypeptidase/D-alanyl-D-alanine-endopeptidase (penicillin-binding protein 4)